MSELKESTRKRSNGFITELMSGESGVIGGSKEIVCCNCCLSVPNGCSTAEYLNTSMPINGEGDKAKEK